MTALKLYNHNNCTLYTTLQNNGLIGLKISKSYCEILHLSVLPPSQQRGVFKFILSLYGSPSTMLKIKMPQFLPQKSTK